MTAVEGGSEGGDGGGEGGDGGEGEGEDGEGEEGEGEKGEGEEGEGEKGEGKEGEGEEGEAVLLESWVLSFSINGIILVTKHLQASSQHGCLPPAPKLVHGNARTVHLELCSCRLQSVCVSGAHSQQR